LTEIAEVLDGIDSKTTPLTARKITWRLIPYLGFIVAR